VVRELRRAGWKRARALKGGWAEWRARNLPVDPAEPNELEPQSPSARPNIR